MPSFTDCSYDKLCRAARKLGFDLFEGKKHCKVKDDKGNLVTLIPRKNRIKRGTVIGIVDAFVKYGIDEDRVKKIVNC